MSSQKSQYDLFGLDLALVGYFFRDGWTEAAGWPVFRWFNPQPPVRVIDAEGRSGTRLGLSATPVKARGRVARVAVELPEELLLRRSLTLPRLSGGDLEAAVALDARGASPFAEGDLVWGFGPPRSGEGDALVVESVLSSRSLVEQHLRGLSEFALPPGHEVWAGGAQPIQIRGFGEAGGKSGASLSRWVNLLLALLAVGLMAAIALTPWLQSRVQVLDAMERHQKLVKSSSPQVGLRADLMKFNAGLEKVDEIVGAYANPLQTLDELSKLLPDDVLVNTLEIKGNTVRVTGQAANAARLLDLLASQSAYRDVKAPAATTRVQGSAKEYFTIEFKVDRTERGA